MNDQQVLPDLLKSLYAPVQQELESVEKILRTELRSDAPFVDELLRYGGRMGGKRLRPALLLLTARAVGDINANHLTLAAVLEMIHTATLIHDDVLDEADQRRHLATVNSRWNNETSVLLGDYLFTHAFYLASTLESTHGCRAIGQSTNLVCNGELRQVGSRGNHALTEAEYMQIIQGKTAELCACACGLGSHYAGANEELEEAMAEFGRSLGIAFQIADDLLDLLGDEEETGKSLGTDLEKQKPTLPLIHVYEKATEDERQKFVALLETPSPTLRTDLQEWLDRYDGLAYARQRAQEFAENARQQLEKLPASPSREILQQLTYFVVARSM